MVNFCAVIGCSNRAGCGEKKSFYRIPSVLTSQAIKKTRELSAQRQRTWIAAMRRDDLKTEKLGQYRVCSDHFLSGKGTYYRMHVLC